MKKYIKFREYNDWEGEVWNWFIPIEGNDKSIEKLKKLIKDSEYSISNKEYSEKDVDLLISEESRTGYFNENNKLIGILEIPDNINSNNISEYLYKGTIRSLMKNKENI